MGNFSQSGKWDNDSPKGIPSCKRLKSFLRRQFNRDIAVMNAIYQNSFILFNIFEQRGSKFVTTEESILGGDSRMESFLKRG